LAKPYSRVFNPIPGGGGAKLPPSQTFLIILKTANTQTLILGDFYYFSISEVFAKGGLPNAIMLSDISHYSKPPDD